MSDEQTNCTTCGAPILLVTAQERGGRCLPCATGTRAQIEAGREFYQREKAYRQSPEALFWRELVQRRTPIAAWSQAERLYYAVRCLNGEVFNGGFHQYFFNSSGNDYQSALEGLLAMGATQSLKLLRDAKALMYGDADISTERDDAIRVMYDPDVVAALDRLDQAFWAEPDGLSGRLRTFARQSGLYAQDEADPI